MTRRRLWHQRGVFTPTDDWGRKSHRDRFRTKFCHRSSEPGEIQNSTRISGRTGRSSQSRWTSSGWSFRRNG